MRFSRFLWVATLTVLLLASITLQADWSSAQPPLDGKNGNFNPDGKIPWLGVSRWMANQQEVVLCGVLKNGPAGKAGLQFDDVIVSINKQAVPDLKTFHTLIDGIRVGQTVPLEVRRVDQPMTLKVLMEPLPADGGIGMILQAIEAGEAWAMMEMGIRLINARGDRSYIDKDLVAAAQWFWRAVDAGDTAAPLFLAKMYLKGEGVGQDFEVAQELLMMARQRAEEPDRTGVHRGLASAASNELARMCLGGQGPNARPELALPLLEDAAHQGSPYAMTELGKLYEQGTHVAHDEAKMKYWYSLAANYNYPRAIEALQRLNPDVAAKGSPDSSIPVTPASPESPTLVSDGRYIWAHSGGFYRASGNKVWLESFRVTDQQRGGFRFEEVTRNDQYVELLDSSRGFTVRLSSDSMTIRGGQFTDFTTLYQGSWWTVGSNGTK